MYTYHPVYFISWFRPGTLLWYLSAHKEGKEILSFSGSDEPYHLLCDGTHAGLVTFTLYLVLSGFFGDSKLEVPLSCVGSSSGKASNSDTSLFAARPLRGLLDWKKDKKNIITYSCCLERTFFFILVSGVSYAGPYRTLIFFFRSIIFQSVLSSLLVLQCKAWQGFK